MRDVAVGVTDPVSPVFSYQLDARAISRAKIVQNLLDKHVKIAVNVTGSFVLVSNQDCKSRGREMRARARAVLCQCTAVVWVSGLNQAYRSLQVRPLICIC